MTEQNAPHPLTPGRNCWRVSHADRATVIIDADRYFRAARSAMLQAKRQILLVGWDFDARIPLTFDETDHPGIPRKVGPFLSWLVRNRPELDIHILRWDTGALGTFSHPTTLATTIKWHLDKRIHVKLDGFHPVGGSHHQKIVVVDDCLAFCGGIDMTKNRWDTRHHRDNEPGRSQPGHDHGPWHDATTALKGKVAKDLGDLCRERWERAGGDPITPPEPADQCWPEGLEVGFTDATVAISRSRPDMPDCPPVREIEQLYLDLIARTKKRFYAESQYFASRKVAEAIAQRLQEPDGPEFVIVNPVSAEGWLEPIAMDTARARVMKAIEQVDKYSRFRLYHARTRGGKPIYIHSKVTVVDDCVLRVGSSNFNNRSMRLDTECDITIDATLPENADEEETIAGIRNGLLGEHLDVPPERVAARLKESGSLIETIESLRGQGKTLFPYEIPNLPCIGEWLADNEILDPEGPEETFEPLKKRSLFRRLRNPDR
ncbi:phospholipase D-like domain-containing protein [Stakelama tenebrarum]|uniref:Phospholipase D n=1 Tax=Stakelama tenebrarum TaxID=2711215 RepID=A0A6G6Y8T7_9SPHN|nr:phospholipase D-like domain-containing protein [Sphingosinithalassobacter tenebrarum]QIG81217.1 phospholipase [Sphingosinithalassobacter tenebrarum]